MIEIIEAVRDKRPLAPGLVHQFVASVVEGRVPDYQIAAFLMAVYLNGLEPRAIFELTEAMARLGSDPVPHRGLVDKHSTGGVGDKTTLILAPLVSSLGIPMVKMSGRGLGHTGGTLDKLESIPGFRVSLDAAHLARQVEEVGVAVVAQSARLAPADGIFYALRDVTGTVDSLGLIASSIMSKKLAAGAPNLVLDVKVGSGALMKSVERARELARLMIQIGESHHMRVTALLTNMEEPLGHAIGNALEVNEAVACLRGEGPADLREEVLSLAAHMVALAQDISLEESSSRVESALSDGRAYEQFLRWIAAQGGEVRAVEQGLPLAQPYAVRIKASGVVSAIDAAALGRAAQTLGAGRTKKEDPIDYGVGLRWFARLGEAVPEDGLVAEVYAREPGHAERAIQMIQASVAVGGSLPKLAPVLEVLTHA